MRIERKEYKAAAFVAGMGMVFLGVCIGSLIFSFVTWREAINFSFIARGLLVSVIMIMPIGFVNQWKEI